MIKGHGLRIKRKENIESLLRNLDIHLNVETLIIMPSFNDFLGGQAINMYNLERQKKFKGFIGPVLRSGSIDFENAEIYLLDGTFLGSLSQLRKISNK